MAKRTTLASILLPAAIAALLVAPVSGAYAEPAPNKPKPKGASTVDGKAPPSNSSATADRKADEAPKGKTKPPPAKKP